jgi:hypothetical protein
MKIYISMVGLLASLTFANTSFAGPGESCHFHGSKAAPESVILKCADLRKQSLIKSGKLDKSWEPIKHSSIDLVDGKKSKEWKVVFKNSAIQDKTKVNLYMFFTPPGNFIATNHTGQ